MEPVKESIEKFPEYVKKGYELPKYITLKKPSNVIICGLGGSGIAGHLIKQYLNGYDVKVCQDYDLPKSNPETLVILSSYSGNTEEVISCFKETLKRNLQLICICSGGKLKQLCDQNNAKFILIPEGKAPRMSLAYSFFAILKILELASFIQPQEKQVIKVVEALKSAPNDRARDIASKIKGKVALIYGTPKTRAAAYRWKCQINENAKELAIWNVFPEMNHNEIMGFANISVESQGDSYYAVFLKDEDDHERNKKRVDVTKQILLDKGVKSTEIYLKGHDYLSRLFTAVIIGDWVSYYLAVENGVNPDPFDLIEEFKKKLH